MFFSVVLLGIFTLVMILVFGIVITAFVQGHKRHKQATEWMRSEREARARWRAAGAKPTGRPGTGRAQFRAPAAPTNSEESFLTRMRKVFSK